MKSHNPCPISLQAVSDVKNNFFFFLLSSLIKYCFLAFYSLEFILSFIKHHNENLKETGFSIFVNCGVIHLSSTKV